MIVEGDSEVDEDDWLSDRRLRESRKREVKEEKSNDDVVVYDFEKESYPGNMNAEEDEMTCGETCLYEPTKFCKSGKWGSLVAAIFMDLVAGTGYAVSLFTDLFKENLNLDQAQVDWISTCGNAGLYSAILGGLFYNRCGPRLTALIGAILIGIGFGGMYACAREDATCDENSVGFLNFIAQHGSGWIASCTMATSVRNFSSHDRGIVVGIAKGAFAVSTGFVAQLYIGMYKPDALHFLLFLAFFSPCVIFLCVPFLRLVPFDEHEKASSSSCGLITTSILILFNGSWLVLVVLLQQMSESKQIKLMSLCTCIVFMSMILCVSPCIRCCKTSANRRRGRRAIELTKNSILKVMRRRKSQKYERVSLGTASMPSSSSSIQHDVEKAIQKVKRRTIRVRSMSRSSSTESALRDVVQSKSLLEVLVLKDFYILAVAFLVGSGSGLMYINNLTQIVQSQMESSNMTDSQYLKTKNTLIVLFGASNLYGRVVIGAVSDRLGGKTIRAGLLSACLTLMGISHFILSASENDVDSLYPSTLLVGFFFGCVFSLCASLVADLFGPKYFAGNYGAADIAPSLGSLIFSTLLAGEVYDSYATIDGNGTSTCYGSQCFKTSFVLTGVACIFVGAPFSWLLRHRILVHEKSFS